MSEQLQSLYNQLPSIDRLLREPSVIELIEQNGHSLVVSELRQLQQDIRHFIANHKSLPTWYSDLPLILKEKLVKKQAPGLRPVFNLTGTVLHTNLGRALLSQSVIEEISKAMNQAVTLEYDLQGGDRGHRDNNLSNLLQELTGAEAACIVNNNAAAVLLILATLANNKQVIVSRGELVEIGGSFRVPDVMNQAGCQLVEVGTTNRTHLHDYQNAINDNTALLMKVHTSNYYIQGFTASVPEKDLVELGQQHHLPVVVDLGSGSLVDLTQYQLPPEPMPQKLIADGVDLVCFSGDKLLGGPQAGIILGKKKWIDLIQKHPLKRALRAGKLTLAALDATLRLYLQPEKLPQTLPTLRLLSRPEAEIQNMANQLQLALAPYYADQFTLNVEPCLSQIGSGSLPVERLPSYALTFTPKDEKGSTLEGLVQQWRYLPKPVIGRIQNGKLWLDLRCLEDVGHLIKVLTL